MLNRCALRSNERRHAAGLSGLQALDVLDVHSNRVSSLRPLTVLTNLRIVNVASNHLSTLPDLSPLSHLLELNLRRNSLRRVGGSVASGANVATGAVGGDASGVASAAGAGLPTGLQRLYLENNCIAQAQDLLGLAGLVQLQDLGVAGNPLAAQGHPMVRSCNLCVFVTNANA